MIMYIRKRPNTAYFLITFGWTWMLVFALIISGLVQDVNKPTLAFILVGLLCNISPSIAAFIVTRITRGKEGTEALIANFKKKTARRRILIVLAIVPSATILTTVISHSVIHEYQFALTIPLILMGLIWPLFSSFGEEFGWRGYILPQLLARFTPLQSGIILGVIWEIWHLPMHYIGYKSYGQFMIPAFILILITMTLHAVIMTMIYIKTGGALKLMILYHWTITGSSILLGGFLQTDVMTKYSIQESIITALILFVIAMMMNVKKLENNRGW
ncbi:CPBP family intramembrane metalloprotease [Dehalobacter sp. DCM]|uniref:CPBP family intramembrane glutamic endopeptidase n=1 Tax=Dehalobacter sp. DCM TaxID=2907827 RepID=UPI0030814A91|nr:CPBP family intramembrane metalloprotease [Dehalobacter sp. DCM]